METKKYKHADLERKRSVFFQIGLIVALGSAFAAFEWSSQDVQIPIEMIGTPIEEDLDLPEVIKVEEKKTEPIKKFKPLEEIIIAENDDPTATTPDFTSEVAPDASITIPETQAEEVDETVHVIVERMPDFPGGMGALMNYFARNIRYPVICAELNVQGKVYVGFVVDKDGSVTDVKVLRSPDANLSKEALRVVSLMPKWKPGKQGGKAVKVSYTVPVNFKLQ